MPHEKMRPTVVGVNHFPFVTELDANGTDGIAKLSQMVDELGGWEMVAPAAPGTSREDAEPFSVLDFARRHYLKLRLFEQFGCSPARETGTSRSSCRRSSQRSPDSERPGASS